MSKLPKIRIVSLYSSGVVFSRAGVGARYWLYRASCDGCGSSYIGHHVNGLAWSRRHVMACQRLTLAREGWALAQHVAAGTFFVSVCAEMNARRRCRLAADHEGDHRA